MRPGVWFLPVLLSLPATASTRAGGPALQRRTLVVPSRPGQVPPLELHVAAGVARSWRWTEKGAPGGFQLPMEEEPAHP